MVNHDTVPIGDFVIDVAGHTVLPRGQIPPSRRYPLPARFSLNGRLLRALHDGPLRCSSVS